MKKEPLKDKKNYFLSGDSIELKDSEPARLVPAFKVEDVASAVAWLKQQFINKNKEGQTDFQLDEILVNILKAFPDCKNRKGLRA